MTDTEIVPRKSGRQPSVKPPLVDQELADQELADQFKIRIVARTLPGKQFEVGRALRVRIAQAFLRAGITVQPAVDTAQPTGAV